jgi:hypothetical protein
MADEQSIVIRQSRGALGLRLGVWFVLAVALYIVLLAHLHGTVLYGVHVSKTVPSIVLYPALFLTIAVAAVTSYELAFPAEMTLEPGGVTCRTLWETQHLEWDDVEQFVVRHASENSSRELVMYNLSPRYVWEHPHMRSPFGAFAAEWELAPLDVVKLLNSAKERWGNAPTLYYDPGVSRAA